MIIRADKSVEMPEEGKSNVIQHKKVSTGADSESVK